MEPTRLSELNLASNKRAKARSETYSISSLKLRHHWNHLSKIENSVFVRSTDQISLDSSPPSTTVTDGSSIYRTPHQKARNQRISHLKNVWNCCTRRWELT